MKCSTLLSGLFVFASATSCYIPEDERALFDKPTEENLQENDNKADDVGSQDQCARKLGFACISGQIIKSPDISLDGVEYFDAEEMGHHLHRHVRLHLESSFGLGDNSFDLSSNLSLTNENFSDGFRVYLKGERAEGRQSSNQGLFKFSKLTSGWYSLRAQKKIDFSATPRDVSSESTDSANENEASRYCAILFHEADDLFLEAGDHPYLGIERYNLKVIDKPCSNSPVIFD